MVKMSLVAIFLILSACPFGKSLKDMGMKENTEHGIVKRYDGLMNKLVDILVAERFERKNMMKKMEKMESKMEKILKQIDDRDDINEQMNRSSISAKIEETKMFLTKQLKKKISDTKNQFQSEINSKIGTVNAKIQMLQKTSGSRFGAVYVRWGKTSCPTKDTKLIYSGYAAGSSHRKNSGANTLCLPKDPNWRKYQDSADSSAKIYGAEYETYFTVGELLHKKHYEYDVPCAVCQSQKRSHVLMVPAKDRCHHGWHLEYRGYLMSDHENHGASEYNCVDANPDLIGSKTNHNGKLFYPVVAVCGALPCLPYVNGRELTCAVCTF